MATTTSTKAARSTHSRTGSSATKRRAVRKAPTRARKGFVSAEETTSANVSPPTQRTARRVGMQTLRPLKEVYFVGLGLVDWAAEHFWSAERNLSERGQRRNAVIEVMASNVGAAVSSRTAMVYRGAREQLGTIGEKLSDRVCEGASKLSARGEARSRRRGMPGEEEQAMPTAQPV